MVKYDEGFKQRMVGAYLAGEGGYRSIANRFDIPSKSNVKKWVNAFKRFGKDALIRKQFNKTYPVQFKIDVINYKLRTGESFQAIALKYDIPEPSTIINWLKKWQQEGIEGLSKTKERPPLPKKTIRKKL